MSKYSDLYKTLFGEDLVREKYKLEPHSFTRVIVGKQYCSKCGLVALNNDFTRWAVRMRCKSSLHPNYENERRKAHK